MDQFFKVLGLTASASLKEVREAYKDLVKVRHPDRFANDPRLSAKAEEKLKEINNAYEHVLSFFGDDSHAASSPEPTPEQDTSQRPTDSTGHDAHLHTIFERRRTRLKLLAFVAGGCLILGASVYLARQRRGMDFGTPTTAAPPANPSSDSPASPPVSSAGTETPQVASLEEGQTTEAQLKEGREVLLLVDILDLRLRKAWNESNDFGVTTSADRTYLKGATTASQNITARLQLLSDSDYKTSLLEAALAYKDVGQIRLSAGRQNGEAEQREIVKQYGIENSDPHLWAWRVLEFARRQRNAAAVALGLPEQKFSQSKNAAEPRTESSIQEGRYVGTALNETAGASIQGSAAFAITSADISQHTIHVDISFSDGLCGEGSLSGKLYQRSFDLTGNLTANNQICGVQAWNIVTACRWNDNDKIHCSYVLTRESEPSRTQRGSFEVVRVDIPER